MALKLKLLLNRRAGGGCCCLRNGNGNGNGNGNAALPFPFTFPFPNGNRSTATSSACSSSNLFIGGLSYDTNETALKDAFSQYGDVIAVRVICHPTTGKSKGFGFVKFSSENQAAAALQKLNGQASVSSLSSFIHHSYIVWSMYL
ncbi:hypothetical protein SORBI_3003G445100 [Sorghum bicolor]|uniref:RRM domain-containing protein n=1 Tax=Sorghum bicolor TaxID=4558 RepID=A0A1W0W1K9_SORBI|nr:hypothetical protein SORBI_3003G445100 [Sorghum bicolor]